MPTTLLEPATLPGTLSGAAATAAERRRELRYATPAWPVFLSAAISALAADAQPFGYVRDISRGGVRVAGLRGMALGREVGLCIALPPQWGATAFQRVNFLKVTGRAVWAGVDDTGDGFELGYEFVAPPKSTLRRIDALLAALADKD